MSGPFKLKYKNSAFPFKSPTKHTGHGDDDPAHTHTEPGDWDPNTGGYIAPEMDFGIQVGTGGVKGIIGKGGVEKLIESGKKVWSKSSTLGKAGIVLGHGALAGLALANPQNLKGLIKGIGGLFTSPKKK